MRRREFIALLGSTAAAWPLTALAEQPALPVIGYLGGGSPEDDAFRGEPFRRGLKTLGFVERQNVTIEYRWAEGQYQRFPRSGG